MSPWLLYPTDRHADKNPYSHDGRINNASNPQDRRADMKSKKISGYEFLSARPGLCSMPLLSMISDWFLI